MKINTVRLALLLGLTLAAGGLIGAHSDTYVGGDGTAGVRVGPMGVEYADGRIGAWACPTGVVVEWAHTLLNCPHRLVARTIRPAGEDTRDGLMLTEGMESYLAVSSPDTDPWQCRYRRVDGQTLIVCADGTTVVWS